MHLRTVVLFVALSLSGCAAPTITGEAAHELVARQGALLLDVRTPGEFSSGHLDGAVNIPVQELESKLASLTAKKDQDVVVYCRSGHRSSQAAEVLKKAGFTKVHDLGSLSNWK
jgi:phage shock protein E